jgi:hypothetical protein
MEPIIIAMIVIACIVGYLIVSQLILYFGKQEKPKIDHLGFFNKSIISMGIVALITLILIKYIK